LKVWLSPSAGAENYPVYSFKGKSLTEIAVKQLQGSGVLVDNIVIEPVDTTTDKNYFSHSQGDKTQRFAILTYIKL
jgi:copper oxidase (laccase) domain-containing protein